MMRRPPERLFRASRTGRQAGVVSITAVRGGGLRVAGPGSAQVQGRVPFLLPPREDADPCPRVAVADHFQYQVPRSPEAVQSQRFHVSQFRERERPVPDGPGAKQRGRVGV